MGKTKRKWIKLDYTDPDALRAEDIPYDGTDDIKTKIDSIPGPSTGDILFTTGDPGSEYLRADGRVYDQATYPALSGEVDHHTPPD